MPSVLKIVRRVGQSTVLNDGHLGAALTYLLGLERTGTQGNRRAHLETKRGRISSATARSAHASAGDSDKGILTALVHVKEEEDTH